MRWAFVLLALAAVPPSLSACNRSRADAPKPAPAATAAKAILITAARAEAGSVQRQVETVGSFAAWEESQVRSEVSGTVDRIFVDLGDRVAAGAVLARLDQRLFRLEVEQAEAALRAAGETRTRMEAEVEDARANVDRAEELHRRELISTQERDRVRTNYRVMQAQREGSGADIERMAAALAIARKKLADTTIRSPISGLIARRHVNVGEYVTNTPISTSPLFTIVAIDPLKYTGTVPERFAPELRAGQEVELRVEAFGDQAFTGRITRLAPTVDVQTRTLALEARVPNGEVRLRPGFFAKGAVLLHRDDQVVFVPQEAVAYLVGINKAFVVLDGKVQERVVKPGVRQANRVEITGVRAGEVVATSNLSQLFDGAPVTVSAAKSPPPTP
jgi:membrane fusion protein (multidrug efflux system)